MRKNHPNFRRDVKNLWKAHQRGTITNEGIKDWFQERGFFGRDWDIPNLLRTNIKSRIFVRLGRAASKQGKLIFIADMLGKPKYIHMGNNRYVGEYEPVKDYRTIPFYFPAVRETTSVKVETGWLGDNGEFISGY